METVHIPVFVVVVVAVAIAAAVVAWFTLFRPLARLKQELSYTIRESIAP